MPIMSIDKVWGLYRPVCTLVFGISPATPTIPHLTNKVVATYL